jgi:putative ABC transport system permease protein
MIRHLLRLAWNRKSKNALLSIELLIAFAVLLVVMTIIVAGVTYVRLPLGYSYANVIAVEIRDDIAGDDTFSEEQRQRTNGIIASVRGLPGVVHVAGCQSPPMSIGGNQWRMEGDGGKRLDFGFEEATDEFAKVMDIKLVAGRWYGPEDDASPDRPVVINRRLALEALGDPTPIGRDLLGTAKYEPGERHFKIVGVVDDYRKQGELGVPANFLFMRKRLDDPKERPPNALLVSFDPARREGLEKRIEDVARSAAPGWGFSVKPLTDYRTQALRIRLAPAVMTALVALFLLAMVAMGLAGVFWQSIAQRRSEVGVRRAAGATARGVVWQIVGEVWAMVTLVVVIGLILALQLPLFGVAQMIGVPVFVVAVVASVVLIYVLAGLAALAPAAVAARIQPADALRTE